MMDLGNTKPAGLIPRLKGMVCHPYAVFGIAVQIILLIHDILADIIGGRSTVTAELGITRALGALYGTDKFLSMAVIARATLGIGEDDLDIRAV